MLVAAPIFTLCLDLVGQTYASLFRHVQLSLICNIDFVMLVTLLALKSQPNILSFWDLSASSVQKCYRSRIS